MLTLTRRPGESIFIYPSKDLPPDMTVAKLFEKGAIEVCVAATSNGMMKLLIGAPKELDIVRNELIS